MSKASLQDITALKNRIIDAALKLAAIRNWDDVSMYAIAQKADIAYEDLHALFDDKDMIVAAYARQVDNQIGETFHEMDIENESEKDRLFDVFMERFDILNENREAVQSILNTVTLQPQQAVMSLPYLCQSIKRMSETAKIPMDGLKGSLKMIFLTGCYLKVLRSWIKDESPDMAATMSSLDKALGYYEKI